MKWMKLSASAGTASATGTIIDNNAVPTVPASITASSTEGDAVFTLP
jgi:hypothetical protein